MRETKTGRIPANLTPTDKSAFEDIANELGMSAGGLATKLLESYLEQKRIYGNQVFFPPKFHTFESFKIQEELDAKTKSDPANASLKRKAG